VIFYLYLIYIYQIYQGYDFKLKGTVISLQKPIIKEIWIWTMTIIGNYIYIDTIHLKENQLSLFVIIVIW
jgi:hypothetical protein